MKTTLIIMALCASINAVEPPPATPVPKPPAPAAPLVPPKATPKPFPFTPSGALAGNSPKLGGESRRIKDGWYLEQDARGVWKKTTKVK